MFKTEEKLVQIYEDPEIAELQEKLSDAQRTFEEAKGEEEKLKLIISDIGDHRG